MRKKLIKVCFAFYSSCMIDTKSFNQSKYFLDHFTRYVRFHSCKFRCVVWQLSKYGNITKQVGVLSSAATYKMFLFEGLQETTWAIGYDGGATLMGILFHLFGTQMTFVAYSCSSSSGILVFILLFYIFNLKSNYEKLDQNSVDK